MEIVKTKIKVTIYGQEIELKAPKAIESADFIDEIGPEKKLSSKEMIVKTTDFLKKMGLPEEVCDDLELEHLQQLVEFITKKK